MYWLTFVVRSMSISPIINRPFAPIKLSKTPVESQVPQEPGSTLAVPPPEFASPDAPAVYVKVVAVTARDRERAVVTSHAHARDLSPFDPAETARRAEVVIVTVVPDSVAPVGLAAIGMSWPEKGGRFASGSRSRDCKRNR